MFSSGIIVFGMEGSSGFGFNFGDWKVWIVGIKLFFIICLLLLVCIFGLWFFVYVYVWMKLFVGRLFKVSEKQELLKQGELGVYKVRFGGSGGRFKGVLKDFCKCMNYLSFVIFNFFSLVWFRLFELLVFVVFDLEVEEVVCGQ